PRSRAAVRAPASCRNVFRRVHGEGSSCAAWGRRLEDFFRRTRSAGSPDCQGSKGKRIMNLLSSTALALSFLIGSTIKATLLLVLAAGVAHALRGQSAAGRHHVWSLGIAGLLVLPFL